MTIARWRFSRTLLLFGLMLALLPSLLLGVVLLVQLRDDNSQAAENSVAWRSRNGAAELTQTLFEMWANLDTLAKDKSLAVATYDVLFGNYAYDRLLSLHQLYPQFDAVALFDAQLHVVEAAPLQSVGFDYRELAPELQRTLEQWRQQQLLLPRVNVVRAPELLARSRALANMPAAASDSPWLLVISAPVSLTQNSLIDPYRITGVIVAIVDPQRLLNHLARSGATLDPLAQLSLHWQEQRLAAQGEPQPEQRWFEQQAPLQTRISDSSSQLQLHLRERAAFHLAEVNRTIQLTLGAALLFLALVGLLTHLAIRRMLRPLSQLTAITERFLGGDYSPAAARMSFFEFDEMLLLLNRMADEIKRQLQALENVAETAQAGSQLKSRFLANMSHEIRTPMNAIIGFCQLLPRAGLNDAQLDCLAKIEGASQTLLALLNDILDLTKIEADKLELEQRPFSLRRLLREQQAILGVMATHKGLRLVVSIDDQCHDALIGDPLRLTQILTNLVGNAIKFSEHGAIDIRVQQQATDGHQTTLTFSVSDEGCGIAPEVQPLLFEPFLQADAGVTRRFGGTGLGLSICRRLVQLMGGEISLTSRPGQGTTVHFTLTLERTSSSALPAELDANRHWRFKSALVLVVDDNPLNEQVLRGFLEGAGLQVAAAHNGRQAVDWLRGHEAAMVFMDVQMPELDGISATRLIRSELQLQLPVVALTAHAMSDEIAACLEAGMNDHLSKPATRQQVLAKVGQWLPQQVLARADATTAPPVASPLPPSDAVDVAFGCAQLGSHEAFVRALGQFVERQRLWPEEVAAALREGDLGQLKALLHAVSGVAGNLGARPLRELCQQGQLQPPLATGARQQFVEQLRQALAAIEQCWRQLQASQPAAARPPALSVGEAISQLMTLQRRLALAEYVEFDVDGALAGLPGLSHSDRRALRDALDNCDSEAALAATQVILAILAEQPHHRPPPSAAG